MPGRLNVRNLDEDLIRRLKARAAQNGRSAEAEHREILRQALAGESSETWEEKAARLRAMTADRPQTPSEILQRESRDEAR